MASEFFSAEEIDKEIARLQNLKSHLTTTTIEMRPCDECGADLTDYVGKGYAINLYAALCCDCHLRIYGEESIFSENYLALHIEAHEESLRS